MVLHDHKVAVQPASQMHVDPYQYEVPNASPRVDWIDTGNGTGYVGWVGYLRSETPHQ